MLYPLNAIELADAFAKYMLEHFVNDIRERQAAEMTTQNQKVILPS
jgi:hypothetical protein